LAGSRDGGILPPVSSLDRPAEVAGASASAGAPAPPAAPPRRAWIGPLLLVVLAWVLLFSPQLLQGQRVVLGEAAAKRPFAEFSRERWRETRQRTTWNPCVFLGVPTSASLADRRPQYLPDRALDLAERLHEPHRSPQLWLLLAVLAGTLAVVALARLSWRADPWSAAAAGLAWLPAVPLIGALAQGQDARVLAGALLPVVALGTWGVIAAEGARTRLAASLALALALGLQGLHGHPQILGDSVELGLLLAVQQAWLRRRWTRLVPWTVALALGAAIGAAGWWPALLHGARGAVVAGEPGLAVRDLPALVWPGTAGGVAVYLGVVALALALIGWRRRRADATALFWWAVLIAALLLALAGPLLSAPGGAAFRAPTAVLLWACLALALLAARTLASGGETAPTRPSRLALGGAALIGLLGLAIAFPLAPLARALDGATSPRAMGLDLLLRAAFVVATLILLAGPHAGRRWTRVGLAVLLALDLATAGVPTLRHASGPPAALTPPAPPALARLAAGTPQLRACSGRTHAVAAPGLATRGYDESRTNYWVSWQAACLTGDLDALPTAWRPVIAHDLTRYVMALRAWGVGWVDLDADAPDSVPGLTKVDEEANGPVFALDGALGRAYAVDEVMSLPDADAIARAMTRADFDPARVALTTAARVAGRYPGSAGCVLHWVDDQPEEIGLDVDAPDRAFVVVADADLPGWRAEVDGVATAIVPVDLLVRGVVVPPGHHRLAMRYEAPGLRQAVPVTRAGLGAWIVLAAGLGWSLRRHRRPENPEDPT